MLAIFFRCSIPFFARGKKLLLKIKPLARFFRHLTQPAASDDGALLAVVAVSGK